MFSNITKAKDATNRFSFQINDLDLAIVSGIRRIILTDIPVVGFKTEEEPSIEIKKNTGALHNEFILNRIGLIPICFTEEETETFSSDDYEFELYVKNDTQNMRNVTTHDFTIKKEDAPLPVKEIHRIFPISPVSKEPILITRLRPNEELHILGKAVKSTARVHAGFSPVSLCTLYYNQDPVLASKETNILNKERAYYRNNFGDPTNIQFEIESECALTPKYLVSKAIEILINKLHFLTQEIVNPESEYITFHKNETEVGGVFTFQNEDDTLGNFLQSLMHTHYIRNKKPSAKDRNITYVGYVCPHPLDTIMNLKIVFEDDKNVEENEYIDLVLEHCNRTITYMQNIQAEWLKETSTL